MKIKKLLILFLLMIPCMVDAKSYFKFSEAKTIPSRFITEYPYYQWYIDDFNSYGYNGSSFTNVTNFTVGGFLNESEFNISKHNGHTYLINGRYYWTMTADGSYYKYLENDVMKTPNNTEFITGARVTEYVRSATSVKGLGSYANPWEFIEPNFVVDLTFDNPKITRENIVQTDGIVEYGDIIEYIVRVTNNGEYPAVVVAKEKELSSEISNNKITFTGAGNTSTQTNNANKLMSSEGLKFTINGGQTIEYTFKVKVIGNAGDVIENLVVYSIDGIDTKPADKHKTPIEKQVVYNEVAESGANVVLVLDESNSMNSSGKMTTMKESAREFVDHFMVDLYNGSNHMCIVVMPYDTGYVAQYKCSDDATTLKNYITTTDISGWTPYKEALVEAKTQMLGLKNKYPINTNSVVFLTDGIPLVTSGYDYSYKPIGEEIKQFADIYTIGFRTGTTERDLLVELASCETCFFESSTNALLSTVFSNIAKKITALTKRTQNGVFAISGEIDRSRKLLIDVTQGDGTIKHIEKSFAQAINENYLISSGTMYEINIKMFNPDDKISVTYFLKV